MSNSEMLLQSIKNAKKNIDNERYTSARTSYKTCMNLLNNMYNNQEISEDNWKKMGSFILLKTALIDLILEGFEKGIASFKILLKEPSLNPKANHYYKALFYYILILDALDRIKIKKLYRITKRISIEYSKEPYDLVKGSIVTEIVSKILSIIGNLFPKEKKRVVNIHKHISRLDADDLTRFCTMFAKLIPLIKEFLRHGPLSNFSSTISKILKTIQKFFKQANMKNDSSIFLYKLYQRWEKNSTDKEKSEKFYRGMLIFNMVKLQSVNSLCQLYEGAGSFYSIIKVFDISKYFYKKCLKIHLNRNNVEDIDRLYGEIGVMYFREKNYDLALENLQDCQKMRERRGASSTEIAEALHFIGRVKMKTRENQAASEYLHRAATMSDKYNEGLTYKRQVLLASREKDTRMHDDYNKAYLNTMKDAMEFSYPILEDEEEEEHPFLNIDLSKYIDRNSGDEQKIYHVKLPHVHEILMDNNPDQMYTVKVLNKAKGTKELKSLLQVSGWNGFLKVYGSGYFRDDSEFGIIMEKCEVDLKEFFRAKRFDCFPAILSQLIQAFVKLKQTRIVHSDIKPSNIMIGRDNSVKIIDFGSAFQIDKTDNLIKFSPREGSTHYLSPEVFALSKNGFNLQNGILCDAFKSEVFSLGLCLLDCLSVDISNLNNLRKHCLNTENDLKKFFLRNFSDKNEDYAYQNAAGKLQREINEKLDGCMLVHGIEFVKEMLTVDYRKRLTFDDLYKKLYHFRA